MDVAPHTGSPSCPLCSHQGEPFYLDRFFECPQCAGLFRPQQSYLNPALEKARYEEHENDVQDARYQQFVKPITDIVQQNHGVKSHGLDFGSGTAPVISKVLTDAGYTLNQFDPFFANDKRVLEQKYDYIVCCEVIEHFHRPAEEFAKLKDLLNPGGLLYCMTLLYHDGIDFPNWHYQRDDTHVFIYQKETLEWIRSTIPFTGIQIEGRLITFSI